MNGLWNDGSSADIPAVVSGFKDEELRLDPGQVPAVGNEPNDTYKAGSWNPQTDMEITENTTFIYTYVEKPTAAVTTPPAARDLTYNGKAQELVTEGTASGGTMKYALGSADTAPADGWIDSIPTGTAAVTYYVWYKAVGDGDHNDSPADGPVEVEIERRSITDAEVSLDTAQLTYNGSEQSVNVTGVTIDGLSLTADDYTVTGNTGTNAGDDYIVTVTGQGNFTGTAAVKWNIAEKTMTVSAEDVTVPYDEQPHGITVTVTDPSAGAVVTYGAAEGNYDLGESPAITNVSESPLTVYFKVSAANYKDYTGSAVVTITEKELRTEQSQLTEVPEVLQSTYASVSDLQNAMIFELKVNGEPAKMEQTVFVDVVLEVSFDGGKTWEIATPENFPAGGLEVRLDYPEGTGKDTHEFSVSHMFTVGEKAGKMEYPDVTAKDDGLYVKLTGLSPVAIAWREINAPGPQPVPVSPGHDFFRLCGECELPATGFSALLPAPLPEQPKALRYEPVRMRLMLPTLGQDIELVTMPRDGNSWAAVWLGADAGILEGSALPGEGISIIAAHNTLNAEEYGPFALLSALEDGDVILVNDQRSGKMIRYTVYANELIAPDGMAEIEALAGKEGSALVLLTCENESADGVYLNRRAVFAR